jgi:hypothetical protein
MTKLMRRLKETMENLHTLSDLWLKTGGLSIKRDVLMTMIVPVDLVIKIKDVLIHIGKQMIK